MKMIQYFSFLLIIFGLTGSVYAAEPVDSIVKNAAVDIARFEKQASGLTPARASSANRILKLMDLAYDRLQASPNKDDASWIEVNKRFTVLREQLNALVNPEEARAAAAPQPNPATSAQKSSEGESVVPAPTPEQSSVRPLVSGERVRVEKIARDIQNVSDSLVTTGPSTLQSADEVKARQQRLKQFEEALVRYPQVEDADVIHARENYFAYRKKLIAEFERAKEQLAVLGDVQQRLATLRENIKTYPVPRPLQPPFGEADAKAWVDAASKARTVSEHNLKELAQMEPLAYLPETRGTPEGGAAYDASDLNRLQRSAEINLKAVEDNYSSMAGNLGRRLSQIENDVLMRWQEDPREDENRWLFVSEGKEAEAMQLYDESIVMAQSSVYLERALGREPTAATALIAKINAAKSEFKRNFEIALNTSRLPDAVSKDKARLAIAEKILDNEKYQFGEYRKIVLTTEDIVERESKHSEIDIEDVDVTLGGDVKLSGTETSWNYKWKELKFATALKETDSDVWYIWWITAKNYSSGDSRTTLNEWISGSAKKGNRILKKNI